MRMKREFSLLIIGLFLMSVMVPMVVAFDEGVPHDGLDLPEETPEPEEVADSITKFFDWIGRFTGALFPEGDLDGKGQFSKLLFAIILGMFVYTAVGQFFGDQTMVKWVATVAITLVAFIGMPEGFLETIRSSYGAMGLALLSLVPFMIIFWFTVKADSLFISRVTWIFFSIYYALLFIVSMFKGMLWGPVFWFRLVGLFLGVSLFFFIPSLRKLIWKGQVESIEEGIGENAEKRSVVRTATQEDFKKLAGGE